ncbi:twin-arginine translocase subunit TatC [Lacisediminihabitans changchengi]|uniref:Sec-independent protein translocase protein TatC n=1 Tax=Lacisediminihabitans changchengi TaxID=2787634 RepID=A0A934SRY0_9MICO|nr:twin-arginine translocase subunit TatC [Lacisediminihabitans changchengi]MBK4347840.1 twin-arginine translocase subunit TatC [Lacisediminihabitans changchengi]
MSLGQHLLELRKRLFISAIAVVVLSIAGWFVQDYVLQAIREPIAILAGHDRSASLNFTNISEAFDVRLQITVTIGVVAASPVWLYQILAFLVPGLTSKEKRYTFGFLFSAIPLFLIGCAAGWFVFPHIVSVLGSFVPKQDSSLIGAKDYLGFVLKLVLAVGVAFVLPVFLVLLNFIGLISGISIIRSWRWAILLIFVFCALATPSADISSMFLLAAPMIVLYLAAAAISILHDRSVAKRADKLLDDLGDTAKA